MARYKVAAVIDDLSIADAKPQPIEFTHDGSCWYEALDMLVSEYSAQFRGGARIDADRLVLRSCLIINLDQA